MCNLIGLSSCVGRSSVSSSCTMLESAICFIVDRFSDICLWSWSAKDMAFTSGRKQSLATVLPMLNGKVVGIVSFGSGFLPLTSTNGELSFFFKINSSRWLDELAIFT